MASCSTPTRPTDEASTASGACTRGSTAPRSGAMRPEYGGGATTSTTEVEAPYSVMSNASPHGEPSGYSPRPMTRSQTMGSVALLALTTMLALGGRAGEAAGYTPGCGQIPIVYGSPPWGFHTGPSIGATGSFARGHGNINLE